MKFPGRIGPGLIEAELGGEVVKLLPGDFPGELARASLKPGVAIDARNGDVWISRANWPGPH